jgi:hypothetical protein
MRYTKTIVITMDMIDSIENGDIKIKSGQWVKYEWMKTKSRFVGVTKSGSIWAVHKDYSKYITQNENIKRFQ